MIYTCLPFIFVLVILEFYIARIWSAFACDTLHHLMQIVHESLTPRLVRASISFSMSGQCWGHSLLIISTVMRERTSLMWLSSSRIERVPWQHPKQTISSESGVCIELDVQRMRVQCGLIPNKVFEADTGLKLDSYLYERELSKTVKWYTKNASQRCKYFLLLSFKHKTVFVVKHVPLWDARNTGQYYQARLTVDNSCMAQFFNWTFSGCGMSFHRNLWNKKENSKSVCIY